MEKVKCNTCEQKVMEEEANPHGYYMEGWQCHACTERAEILADEGLTVEERILTDS